MKNYNIDIISNIYNLFSIIISYTLSDLSKLLLTWTSSNKPKKNALVSFYVFL